MIPFSVEFEEEKWGMKDDPEGVRHAPPARPFGSLLAARSRVLLLGKKNLLASKIIFSLLLSARRISLTPPRRVRSRL